MENKDCGDVTELNDLAELKQSPAVLNPMFCNLLLQERELLGIPTFTEKKPNK